MQKIFCSCPALQLIPKHTKFPTNLKKKIKSKKLKLEQTNCRKVERDIIGKKIIKPIENSKAKKKAGSCTDYSTH